MKNTADLARILLRQIEKEKSQSSFWIISAISKLFEDNPDMKVKELMTILKEEMPKSVKEYIHYLRQT